MVAYEILTLSMREVDDRTSLLIEYEDENGEIEEMEFIIKTSRYVHLIKDYLKRWDHQ